MVEIIEQTATIKDQMSDGSLRLFQGIMPSKLDSFKSTAPKEPEGDYITLSSIFKKDDACGTKETEEAVFAGAKGGRNCELIQNIMNADRAVQDHPLIKKEIAKQEAVLTQAQKSLKEVTQKLKDDVYNSLGKGDWAALLKRGPDPFTFDKLTGSSINFNQEQRAWLKENHLDLYKKLLTHDSFARNEQQARVGRDELQAIQDRPITARLELVQFHRKTGNEAEAITTLTEIAAMQRSPNAEASFRQEARLTNAAWDPVFRKIIEADGGDILDYIQRWPSKEKDLFRKLKF